MKLSRSSSFESCLKAALSWSVMIQTTSSFSHFLYTLLSSILSDAFCCFFCFSVGLRLRGSTSSETCEGELAALDPAVVDSGALEDGWLEGAGLSLCAPAGAQKTAATARITTDDR